MVNVNEDQIRAVGEILNDTLKPLKQRFRALFTLKNLGGPGKNFGTKGGHCAIDCIANAFSDSSALLKHELAYCLGQMQDPYAIPVLINVLEDRKQEPMVRHEAGEALGAIGSPEVLNVLEKFVNDSTVEVAETCQLAIARIRWLLDVKNGQTNPPEPLNPYFSVDPTPPASSENVDELRKVLLDETQTLFERYRVMFALRNKGGTEATRALAEGLHSGGALFRHEVAFVLGQMQDKACIPQLIEALEDVQQNEMVRHECAEALGSIAAEECQQVLQQYLKDDKRVVRESCVVALDMCDYENSTDFQYADTLSEVSS